MKKFLSWNNLFFAAIVVFILVKQGPVVLHNFQQEGLELNARRVDVFWPESGRQIQFPPKTQNSLLIFWSSTCAPCKLEMSRLKKSVESGKIDQEDIFAVNLFEDRETSRRFLRKNNYPFIFIHAPRVVQELGVQVTPTNVFLEGESVLKMSSGISLTGIWSAESFLSD